MKLYDTGVYLLNGQKIVPENQADVPVSKEDAAKNTIPLIISLLNAK
jgi:aconitate hydratase